VTHLFPSPAALAAADLTGLGVPRSRRDALTTLAAALAGGEIALDPGADRIEVERRLLAEPGIGPWTASYIALRALGDPDVFLPTDVGVRHALAALGARTEPHSVAALAQRWRPWRSYALIHLWSTLN
jgi:AraC family transcriptional regulator of adaptative response / DNA-3-methyladenine glycosylase II